MSAIPTDELYPEDPTPTTAEEVLSEAFLSAPEGYVLDEVPHLRDAHRLTSPGGVSLAMVAQATALGDLLGFLWEERELDRDGTWQLVGQDFIEEPEEAVAFAQRWVALTV